MKIVNPVGRTVTKLDTGANLDGIQPMGCTCSTGRSNATVMVNCAGCACECDHGTVNRDANFKIAKTQRNYVNI